MKTNYVLVKCNDFLKKKLNQICNMIILTPGVWNHCQKFAKKSRYCFLFAPSLCDK